MSPDFNAFYVKKKSIEQQYQQAIDDIAKANGQKGAYICQGSSLYKEVAEILAENGCDVKVTLKADDTQSTNYVFWGNAEEGRKGSIDYIVAPKVGIHVISEKIPVCREHVDILFQKAKSKFDLCKESITKQTDSAEAESNHATDATSEAEEIDDFDFDSDFDQVLTSIFSSHNHSQNRHENFLKNISDTISRASTKGTSHHKAEASTTSESDTQSTVSHKDEGSSESETNLNPKELPVVVIKRRKK